MIDAFAQLKQTGTTILLVEQNISFAKRLGDQVAVMDNGQASCMPAPCRNWRTTKTCNTHCAGVGNMKSTFFSTGSRWRWYPLLALLVHALHRLDLPPGSR
jgi:energy-coupling factor transporter ATP-binding protein EcfA2